MSLIPPPSSPSSPSSSSSSSSSSSLSSLSSSPSTPQFLGSKIYSEITIKDKIHHLANDAEDPRSIARALSPSVHAPAATPPQGLLSRLVSAIVSRCRSAKEEDIQALFDEAANNLKSLTEQRPELWEDSEFREDFDKVLTALNPDHDNPVINKLMAKKDTGLKSSNLDDENDPSSVGSSGSSSQMDVSEPIAEKKQATIGSMTAAATPAIGLESSSPVNETTSSSVGSSGSSSKVDDIESIAAATPMQKKILHKLGQPMINALGGVEKVLAIPIIEKWNGNMRDLEQITHPVMFAPVNDELYVIFKYELLSGASDSPDISLKVMCEFLKRTDDNNYWVSQAYGSKDFEHPQLALANLNYIANDTISERCLCDRVTRLINKEYVGKMQNYGGNSDWDPKPVDLESNPPEDAYLSGDDLRLYLKDVKLTKYEKKEVEGEEGDQLYLYDPANYKKE